MIFFRGTTLRRFGLMSLAVALIGAGLPILPAHGAGVEDSGVRRITLRITNPECAAMSPQGDLSLNPNPSDLNDGNLDDAEIVALNEGCHLRAYATGKNRERVDGVLLYLYRAPATGGAFVRYGSPRETNRRGLASWGFRLSPDTNFIYRVEIKSGEVRSNGVNIQLCTGRDTSALFPPNPAELGEGCDVPGEGE